MFNEQEGYPVDSLCRLLQFPRSSYYYQPITREDPMLQGVVEEVAARCPAYRSRRVTQELRRDPYRRVVNRKRIQRLMREMGLVRTQKHQKKYTTDSSHSFRRYPNLVADLEITQPDQVWVSDITYIRLRREFVYLAVIMDVYTRSIRGWYLSRWLDRSLTLGALEQALKLNGHVERAQRTHSEEFYDLYMGELDLKSVNEALREWEHFYNTARPHHSLDLKTPAEYLYEHHLDLAPIQKPSHMS
jgi:transposase InsO family protein